MVEQQFAEDVMFSVFEVFNGVSSIKSKALFDFHFRENKQYPLFKPSDIPNLSRVCSSVLCTAYIC